MSETVEELQRRVAQRDRIARNSTRYWVEAAEAALALLPGASRSDHPAYRLWLRVEMAKAPQVPVVLSGSTPA